MLELFPESKTKNESTFLSDDIESWFGSDVIASDTDFHKSTVLKICFRHAMNSGAAGF